jgi:putative transcriptional regulator
MAEKGIAFGQAKEGTMSKKAFERIAAGLCDAIADARGEPGHVTRVHYPVPPVDVKAVRARQNMTQKEFAATYSIPLMTLVKWEQGQSSPTGPMRVLLHVIDQHPKTVRKVIKTVHGDQG